MTTTDQALELCQVALSVADVDRTCRWYQSVLGLALAGERRERGGEAFGRVSGLPDVWFTVQCLIDRQDWVQLEVFQFARPMPREMPPDWRPCDIGYVAVAFAVPDLDASVRAIEASGLGPVTTSGDPGDRRACVRDADGILVELCEPAAGIAPALRSVTLSVPDLSRARRFWVDALGLAPAPGAILHRPEHEAMWGLPGARRDALVVSAGEVAIELVCYRDPPGRPRAAGATLADRGILNVALRAATRDALEAATRRALAAGYRALSEPFTVPGLATVVYLEDDQGFSAELLHVEPGARAAMGFSNTRPASFAR